MLIDLDLDAWITIVTLVAVMAALLFTRLRSDVVFLGAIGILFVTGVLDTTEAFSGLVSSTVIIVGVMFVVVTGLSFTGVLQWISKHVLGQPKGEVHALLRLCQGTGSYARGQVPGITQFGLFGAHGQRLLGPLSTKRFREEAAAWRRPQRYLHAAIPPHAAQAAGGSTPAAATKKKQTEIKHFNINNKNEKYSAPDLWSLV